MKMRYFIALAACILTTILVHIIYNSASSSKFYIAFLGGAAADIIYNIICNTKKKENKICCDSKEKRIKSRKKYVIFILATVITVIAIVLFNNINIRSKLANAAESLRFDIITSDMKTSKDNNITYYYTGNLDKIFLNNISSYIKEGDNKAVQIFGQTTAYPLNIVLFTTSEKFGQIFDVNPQDSQAVTIYDSIYIPCDNINSHVFLHEYTHAKMNSFCKDKGISSYKIPVWFQEGIAEYASLDPGKYKNVKLKKIEDFRNLAKNKEMSSYQLQGYDTYLQSCLAIKKIIELKGKNAVQNILICTKSMDFYNAFEKAVGLSIDDLQNLLE